MNIIKIIVLLCSSALAVTPVFAASEHKHGGEIYSQFITETTAGRNDHGETVTDWDFTARIGTDDHKLVITGEGERTDRVTEDSEIQALYSKNISEFWDTQIGIRHDFQPTRTEYIAFGIEGLAPYFFETRLHGFINEDGGLSARWHWENDFFVTQKFFLEPFFEANLYAQDEPEREIGAGLANTEIGLRLKYEITKRVTPYLEFRYDRAYGETANLAGNQGEPADTAVAALGVRLMF